MNDRQLTERGVSNKCELLKGLERNSSIISLLYIKSQCILALIGIAIRLNFHLNSTD